ncbi:MAG TPA: PAS domain S-box protein, partial [Candidatus Thermoplasmatota archaeon]|nr:PAS domain S-box protein [Candidatus Thermoplasmatota archaeon]
MSPGPLPGADADLLEHAPVGIYRTTADGHIVAGNATLARIFGFPDLASLRRHLATELHEDPEERKAFLEELQRAAGRPVERRLRLRDARGQTVLVRDFARATLDGSGRILHIDGVLEDVTERERLLGALADTEARYRELFENANDVIYTHDFEGRFTDVNSAATRLYGYTREEFLRRTVADLVDPAHLARARESMAAKAQGAERTEPYELLTRARDGRQVWVEVSTRVVRRAGEPACIQGIARDITERKSAQSRLAEQERKHTQIVEHAPIGLYRTAPDGTILEGNPALARIFGVPPSELHRHNVREFYEDIRQREHILARLATQ